MKLKEFGEAISKFKPDQKCRGDYIFIELNKKYKKARHALGWLLKVENGRVFINDGASISYRSIKDISVIPRIKAILS